MTRTYQDEIIALDKEGIIARQKKREKKERGELSFERLQVCASTIASLLQNWVQEKQLSATVEMKVSRRDFFESQITLQLNVPQKGSLTLKLYEQGGLHYGLYDQTGTLLASDHLDWQLQREIITVLAAELLPKCADWLTDSQR